MCICEFQRRRTPSATRADGRTEGSARKSGRFQLRNRTTVIGRKTPYRKSEVSGTLASGGRTLAEEGRRCVETGALLRDLVRELDGMKTTDELGVGCRTLSRRPMSGKLTATMEQALWKSVGGARRNRRRLSETRPQGLLRDSETDVPGAREAWLRRAGRELPGRVGNRRRTDLTHPPKCRGRVKKISLTRRPR